MDYLGDCVFLFLHSVGLEKESKKLIKKGIKDGKVSFSSVTLDSEDPTKISESLGLPITGFNSVAPSPIEDLNGKQAKSKDSKSKKSKSDKSKVRDLSTKDSSLENTNLQNIVVDNIKNNDIDVNSSRDSVVTSGKSKENSTKFKSQPGLPFKRVKEEEVVFLKDELKNNDFSAKSGANGSYGEKAYFDLKDTRGKRF